MPDAPLPNQALSAFAVGYRPPFQYIADDIAPIVPVERELFEYLVQDKDIMFRLHNTLVSEIGTPNEISGGATWTPGQVQGEALLEPVPEKKIKEYAASGSSYDPLQGASGRVINSLDLVREFRVGQDMIFKASNYAAAFKATPGTKWDAAGSDPLGDILTAQRTTLYPANTIVFGAAAWASFIGNSAVITALNPIGGNAPSAEQVLNFLRAYGFTELYVGRAKYDTKKKGQTAVRADIWGDSVSVHYKSPNLTSPDEPTFAATFSLKFGETGVRYFVVDWHEPRPGTTGVRVVKVARMVVEKFVEAECGYLVYSVNT